MKFNISGEADIGREVLPFDKEVKAESEKHARELIKSRFGSKHGISRANVRIEKVEKA